MTEADEEIARKLANDPETLRVMLRNMAVEAVRMMGLLREAGDWIQREVDNTEVELPDAEDLLLRINREVPPITEADARRATGGYEGGPAMPHEG